MGQLIENLLDLGSGGAQENDVSGGSVHVGDTAAAEIPQITQVFQKFGGVVLAARLSHTNGMKMGDTRKHLRLVAVTADNAAAVTEYADDAAVFPMGPSVHKGQFENTKNIFHNILRNLIFDVVFIFCSRCGLLLEIGHETRPRPRF